MVQKIKEPLGRLLYYQDKGQWIPFEGLVIAQTIPRTPGRMKLAYDAASTTASFKFKMAGVLFAILYEQYDTTNDVTGTVAITDENSVSLFSKATLADGTNTLISVIQAEALNVPLLLDKTYTCTVTLSGAAGNVGNVYVTLFII